MLLRSERIAARATSASATYESDSDQHQNLDKYKNAKSISSDNFFGSEAVKADSSQLLRFQGSQSISSDAFYGNNTRGRSTSGESTFVSYLLSATRSNSIANDMVWWVARQLQ